MINELFDFINNSPSSYNCAENIKELLQKNGFIELFETEEYKLENNKKYFVVRNNSSVIAFKVPSNIYNTPIKMIASHTDSPSLKIKPNFTIEAYNYNTLNTEVYGGPIYSSWFDRPLSIAGRILVKNSDYIEEKIVNINKDLLVIPNLCIHFNREINSGYNYNPTIDLKPLLSNNKSLYDVIEEYYGIKKEDILSFDLNLYNRQKPVVVGASKEFFMAPRIDNLASVYTSLKAFIESNDDMFNVFIAFDNEEVGSNTKQGACGDFLLSTLTRIYDSFNYTKSALYQSLSKSMLISADNAHALHPNYPSKYDVSNAPILNKGLVIKYNANQSYVTDAVSSAIFKDICDKENIKYQEFTNRSDVRGGSTLGNILQTSVSINMIDIGLPQLAMHSSYETAGVNDLEDYYNAMKEFYNSNLNKVKNHKYFN
ncbi:MAG: M18 family aminopeptidase [Anaeroplasmataceae bacterium]